MLYSTVLLAATAFSGVVSALNYSTSGPLTIDPTQFPYSLRDSWCMGQKNNCPLICGDGRASPNNCDPNTLDWTCTCTNGNMPNISDYKETMPFYVCLNWKANCKANHPNDRDGQMACDSVTCGMKNASAAYTAGAAVSTAMSTSTSSMASATASVTAASSTPTHNVAMVMHVAENYGTGVLAAGVLAAFGLAL